MELTIMVFLTAFTEVTRDQVIAAFCGSGQAKQYCNEQTARSSCSQLWAMVRTKGA